MDHITCSREHRKFSLPVVFSFYTIAYQNTEDNVLVQLSTIISKSMGKHSTAKNS